MAKRLTEGTVQKIAEAAAIALTDEERESVGKELEDILDFVDVLRAVDVDGVEPTVHPVPLQLFMREDEPVRRHDREALLARAPEAEGGTFRVPRVLGD
ncbi:Asp-tRNA(Asn)/Glu-tRNA(Gln) amidotransferase subunit GatC [Hydrogenibacillus sp. N12]|uniref:Asp-tRNA(Asn)/Glu-tRNA(Gln) amidotransferase subunit GatC n=1 Tax=Hydrogenibacillus sp. N12 TaxID=2866627 RepID=UPI001C7CE163|nr:Asp-tRNA(Asn)/Glu-tRNA(Gln) amidotransferase subunit GatC [Hydrogenibacillus sp. N12]QZA33318.1 Asp-tRNA(Asn)/Glu-tRNA(Gln) amidotransferase subunit GatC [Hydrogenibacillus sp. N12]